MVPDTEKGRERELDLARTLHLMDALVYRLALAPDGEWRVSFVDGQLPIEHPFRTTAVGGRGIREIIPPEVFANIRETLQTAFDGGCAEYEVEYFPGRWLVGQVKPFAVDETGRVTEILCTNLEITERKKARTELQEQTERLQALVSALPDLIFIFDSDGVYVDYFNQSGDNLFVAPDQFLGLSIEDVMPANVASGARRILDLVVSTGRSGEFRYNLPVAGKEEFYHARLVPFSQGRVMAVVRNVTDLVASEHEVRARAAQLELAQNVARMGHWWLEIQSNRLYWSPEMFRLLGYAEDRPMDLYDVAANFGDKEAERLREAIRQAIRTGQQRQLEFSRVVDKGEERHFLLSMAVTCDAGGVPSYLRGTLQDITGYRRLEAQLFQSQKMDSLGRLAGAMAHDFNNMLQIIHGYGERLKKTIGNQPQAATYLESILKTSEKAGQLVDRILSFSRKSDVSPAPVDLDSFIADCVRMMDPLMGKFVSVTVSSTTGGAVCNIDRTGFEQVLVNLAVNARDAMPDGGKLVISAGIISDPADLAGIRQMWTWLPEGNLASVDVSDTGTGIPDDIRDRVFDPFFTTKDAGSGTGLGLSTAYSIVRHHDGVLFVRESGPTGTTFRILLPVVG